MAAMLHGAVQSILIGTGSATGQHCLKDSGSKTWMYFPELICRNRIPASVSFTVTHTY